MGGKSSTSTQSVAIPPAVLSQYQAVNARANQTASTPFQQYGGEFVAPVNSQQQQGITATNTAANQAQPYYTQATGVLNAGQAATAPINAQAEQQTAQSSSPLTGSQINQYLSPYLGDVLNSTEAIQNQENQQQQAGQLGTAISSGAFGGDRTGLAAANLEQQQDLANSNVISGIANQGYQSALSTAMGEQNIGLAGAAQEANIGQTAYGEAANTASELGSLGSGAQAAALQGAQAQIGAGTLEQQTQQAQDTALYNQFLQQQSYPFQVDQFLANIAEGTGALSGSTTTTTQPGGFFSDKRLKHDIKKIGELFDGQEIYSYKMHGDPRTHIGLIAQKVEKKHPDAVGLAGGYRMVDYGKATEEAANRGHFREGGVVPRRAYAVGGGPYASGDGPYAGGVNPYGDGSYLSAVLQAQREMYQQQGQQRQIPAQGVGHQLVVAQGAPAAQPTGVSKVQQSIGLGKDAYQGYKWATKPSATSSPTGVAPAAQDASAAAAEGATDPAAAQAAQAGAAAQAAPDTASIAAPAAADAAAAGAGADAAGTAAATAGTAAATDAGVDAAAALAAEYAAADVGVAALAAKRGGRIGLAGGGTPYESMGEGTPYAASDGYLVIPDDENTNKLQTAGPLKKQPTGLQTLMTMGDPNSAPGIAGSLFSNQALASGGVARRGYDDGGDVTPSADPPDVTPAPVAAQSAGVKPSWWDRNSKYVLPALSALGAMGTAPTKHLGVALAAGLKAGAEDYVPTQEGLATANLTQQQGRRAQYDADLQQATNAAVIPRMQALASPTAQLPAPQALPAPTFQDRLRAKYLNAPTGSPQDQKDLQDAAMISAATKNPGYLQAAKLKVQQGVESRDYANKQDARDNYDGAVRAYQALKDTNPTLASSAAATANAYQQYTGDGAPIVQNGVQLNPRTLEPLIGSQAQRIGPEAYTDMKSKWEQMIDVPAGDPNDPNKTIQVKAYKKAGFNSADDAVAHTVPPEVPDVPGRTQQQPAAAAPRAVAPQPIQTRAPAQTTPAVAPAAAPSDFLDKTVHDKAFSDPTFRIPKTAAAPGTQFGTVTAAKAADAQKARSELKADADSTIQSSSAAIQYAKAAQQILNSKGAPVTGFFGPAAKAVSSVFGGVDATNYQEVAKYLGNLAVQSGKGNFPNATQKEVGIQFEQLSPSTANTPEALKGLLSSIERQNTYLRDTANRTTEYLNDRGYNGNAQDFFKWNQKYYPRESVNVPKAHLDYLVQHANDPKVRKDFKKKYGYLPGGD